jgi:hypothetical protein
MSKHPTHPREVEPVRQPDRVERLVVETRPWYAQPAVKVLLWSAAVLFVVSAVTAVLIMAVAATSSWHQELDALPRMDALSAAGVFGRGANAEVTARLRAVVTVLKDNFLGFISGSLILGVLALAFAHMRGDHRASERTHSFVFGLLFVAVAGGFVA